ncbi:MAG: cell division protein FtsQ/DivIB, partial [Myxococcota bacterium]
GTRRLTEFQVMNLAGLSADPPSIFSVPVHDIEQTLARNPWIEEALARRKFPDRLIVDVKERSPRAIVHLGDLHYVDREGVVFKRVAPGEAMNHPVITGLGLSDVESPEGRELLARALELVDLWESSDRFGPDQLSEIHIDKGLGLTVITRGEGAEIQFGLDNFPLKMEKLTRLLDRLEEQRIRARRIDLSFRNMIVVRPARSPDNGDTVGL